MSITSTKITATKVLKGTIPSDALPVISKDYNKVVDDLTSIDSRTTTLEGGSFTGTVSNVTGYFQTGKAVVLNHTPVAINTTAAGTLTVVKNGLLAGAITSTSAATVTITLDSVANIITAFAAVGVTITTGSLITFIVDNSQGSNTVTVAVDAGTTIAVATPAITGGATLTVSTANKVGLFSLYLTSATTAILSRII